MNKFIGSGRLAKAPEMRTTQSGKSVCTFTLAMDDGWGENKHSTFLPVVVWGKMAELCGKYLEKGQSVIVDGRVSVRSYDTDNGKKYATEIVAERVEFGAKPKGAGQGNNNSGQFGNAVPDEEIPF